MDRETLAQVFEPFFTTKTTDKGTGLGLSMVHGTALSHGGAVTIDSEPGEGTTVTLLFPATRDSAEDVREIPASAARADEGSGLVLLVDDEPLLRKVSRQMLEGFGYSVAEAKDGREAVEVYQRRCAEIVLVILDFVMPEMDGSEAYRELKKLDPDVRVLISSGFTNDEVVDNLLVDGAVGFVEKPFDRETLAAAVAEALGRRAGPE